MADEVITELAKFELPFRRKASVRKVEFESGMKMVRLVLREGTRITQVDLDAEAADQLGAALLDAVQKVSGDTTEH